MIPFAYIDSSVLLRIVLGQPDSLVEWPRIESGVTSQLTRVECLRTLDRIALTERPDPSDIARRRKLTLDLVSALDQVGLDQSILNRAADPFPTPVRTLDAIHLATAIRWSASTGQPLVFATHDRQLATAALASGFSLLGRSDDA